MLPVFLRDRKFPDHFCPIAYPPNQSTRRIMISDHLSPAVVTVTLVPFKPYSRAPQSRDHLALD